MSFVREMRAAMVVDEIDCHGIDRVDDLRSSPLLAGWDEQILRTALADAILAGALVCRPDGRLTRRGEAS